MHEDYGSLWTRFKAQKHERIKKDKVGGVSKPFKASCKIEKLPRQQVGAAAPAYKFSYPFLL